MFTDGEPAAIASTRSWAVPLLLLLPLPHPTENSMPKHNATTPTRPPTDVLRCKPLFIRKKGIQEIGCVGSNVTMRKEHRTLRQSPAGESVSLEIGPLPRSHQPVSH